jgi:hypothetical protein
MSSGALYVGFALSTLFAPLVLSKLGAKWSLVLGLGLLPLYSPALHTSHEI